MKLIKKGYFILICSALLVGCSNEKEETQKTPEEEQVTPPETEEEVIPYVTPFTGEPVKEEVTARPVIVTINNHINARPQSGISYADVIYEMLAEGNITRLLALYQSEFPEEIGPIRSARDYFVEIAQGFDAFYIAHGYSPDAKAMLASGQIDHINGIQYDGSLFYRKNGRVAPHNSYIKRSNIEKGAEIIDTSLLYQKKVAYTFYGVEESAKIGAEANSVEINYSKEVAYNSLYTYSKATNTYTRNSNNAVTTDELTGEPLALSNILIFETQHKIVDSEGRRDIDIASGGTAYLFQQGIMREVRWENRDGVLKAIEQDSTEVKLVPGQTWVHFVPTNPGITSLVKYSQ